MSCKLKLYGLQFHPKVVHSPNGADILFNFATKIAHAAPNWTMEPFLNEATEKLREDIGGGEVISALSGGVDSSVASVLILPLQPNEQCSENTMRLPSS